MNKNELVKAVASKIDGASQRDVKVIVDALFETVIEAVASGDAVKVAGFGSFEVAERAERTGRNPQTNETIVIPATKVPKFRASAVFKAAVKE